MPTEPLSDDRSGPTFCRYCLMEIEPFNGYDYVTRGPSWRHVATREAFCRTTCAEPEPSAIVREAAAGLTDA